MGQKRGYDKRENAHILRAINHSRKTHFTLIPRNYRMCQTRFTQCRTWWGKSNRTPTLDAIKIWRKMTKSSQRTLGTIRKFPMHRVGATHFVVYTHCVILLPYVQRLFCRFLKSCLTSLMSLDVHVHLL